MNLTHFFNMILHSLHILLASVELRVKIWVFCTTKTILSCFYQFLLGICASIGNQLLYLFSKGCFYEIEPLFAHYFLYFVHLVSFWGSQGQNLSILYHQNYFKLLQSISTMDLCNYRLPINLLFCIMFVFMKVTLFLHIFSYI